MGEIKAFPHYVAIKRKFDYKKYYNGKNFNEKPKSKKH